MDLIEQLLNETRITNVISENHDLGSIDWLAGLSDPSEMISCGYLPQARRRDGESDDAYAHRLLTTLTPEQWEELRAVAMPAAIRRAGYDTSNGRVNVVVAGAPPWAKLGVNVAGALNSLDAERLSGTDFRVELRSSGYRDNSGQWVETSDEFYVVRIDTGARLSKAVGSRYRPIQNSEGFAFLDSVRGQYDAKYLSAMSLDGGAKVAMQVLLPGSSFDLTATDRVEATAVFVNPHDGSGVALCFPTTNRVVCGNTTRVAVTTDGSKGIRIRHTGNIKARIADAQAALAASVQGFATFRAQAEALASAPLADPLAYFSGVQTTAVPAPHAEALAAARVRRDIATDELDALIRSADREQRRRGEEMDALMETYEATRSQHIGTADTFWHAVNTVTNRSTHSDARRKVGSTDAQLSRRFESVLSGDADTVNQVALSQALALIR